MSVAWTMHRIRRLWNFLKEYPYVYKLLSNECSFSSCSINTAEFYITHNELQECPGVQLCVSFTDHTTTIQVHKTITCFIRCLARFIAFLCPEVSHVWLSPMALKLPHKFHFLVSVMVFKFCLSVLACRTRIKIYSWCSCLLNILGKLHYNLHHTDNFAYWSITEVLLMPSNTTLHVIIVILHCNRVLCEVRIVPRIKLLAMRWRGRHVKTAETTGSDAAERISLKTFISFESNVCPPFHQQGDDPCYESDRRACVRFRGAYEATTHPESILTVRSFFAGYLICLMFPVPKK